jgi:D-alanyl-D-alanine carboxypeptidase
MSISRRLRARPAVVATIVIALTSAVSVADATSAPSAAKADAALDAALEKLVTSKGGPPSVAVVVQRGDEVTFHGEGKADVTTSTPPMIDDYMRLASVAKAVSGAVELSAVADGTLSLDDTIGDRLPDLPAAWSKVTLRNLLGHTSGIPDFSKTEAFAAAVRESLLVPPPPVDLLSFVADKPLSFAPGSKYMYSNSDNIIAGLMVEQATGNAFSQELATRVTQPLGLSRTTLPLDAAMPTPSIHGYEVEPPDPPVDASEVFAAGWAWTSGGIMSSPGDANRFIRGYTAGTTTNPATQTEQFRFRPGKSEPPGPGTNSAGLAIFRYQTNCGTVYGHTGNTPGYTQFIAATRDGSRSATVAIGEQVTPKSDPKAFAKLRAIYGLAVCAALAGT